MDMSVVEGEERPVNVNEVPEYAAEIHTYLREMEVRKLLHTINCISRGRVFVTTRLEMTANKC